MNNIPPLTPRERRNAPWNQHYPEPDGVCPFCSKIYMNNQLIRREIELTEFESVIHDVCRNCRNVLEARHADHLTPYLEAWRKHPETMENSIDSYAELRDIAPVPRGDR